MARKVTEFVHLHNHSQYSLLDGASKLVDLVRGAREMQMPAVAVTDHGNMFCAVKLAELGRKYEIKTILGCEVYVAPGDRKARGVVAGMKQGKPYHHLILLVRNATGYQNLIRLVSAGFLEGFYYKPRIDHEIIREHAEGLIALSGCLGSEVSQALVNDRFDEAEQTARLYRDMMGEENYFLELQRHGIGGQDKVLDGQIELSKKLGIPMVATNDCHFYARDDHRAHDVLLCIQTGKTMNDTDRMHYTDHHFFKSGNEMAEMFSDLPEAISNSVEIAARCDFELRPEGLLLPLFPVPEGSTVDDYFEQVVWEGFAERKRRWDELAAQGEMRYEIEVYEERLRTEIGVIRGMGFPGYFLIVWDFMRYAREAGIPVGPGRGSAAGSLVAFCLWITDIDPLKYDLLFERFLNPERVTMPDIDIDFCIRGRADVIRYVTEKYGRDNVAQIITFGTMAARAVIRDVGRALDFQYNEVDKIAKLVPPDLDATIDKALDTVQPLQQLYQDDIRIQEMLDVARKLEGLTRHASTHAAGVVISPKAITEFCPLYKDPKKDDVTTQWAKDEVESIGLLKMDFLGLKTLTLMADTLRRIEEDAGVRIDLEALHLEDEKTYELFCVGNTAGVFQFESAGMQDILRRLKPERFEDLIALNALYRPGPIKSGMIDDFIQRRHGRIPVEYPHPLLEEVLAPTYGVVVYQEQVMRIASVMAGYSLGEADILRRAMGKKKASVMEEQKEKFVAGAVERDITKKDAVAVFELMAHFAGYGFNKSHSAAYALIAYHTAYLKAHYPSHFMAALLTSDSDVSDKVKAYILQCRDMGITVLPPDVNRSMWDFTVEGDGQLRFGMCAVKNVGENAVLSMLETRRRLDGFSSLTELCTEVDLRNVNRRVVESLVKAGAFDAMESNRARMMAVVESALEAGQRAQKDRLAGQASLFGSAGAVDAGPPRDNLPKVEAWGRTETLNNERESLGLYLSGHPLNEHEETIRRFCSHDSRTVAATDESQSVCLAGVISGVRRRKTRKGNAMATFMLEDLYGATEVIVFPDLLERRQEQVEEDVVMFVTGRTDSDDERARMIAEDLIPLEVVWDRPIDSVTIELGHEQVGPDSLSHLAGLIQRSTGSAPVVLQVRGTGFSALVKADREFSVRPHEAFATEVEELLGPGRLRCRLRPPVQARRNGRRGG